VEAHVIETITSGNKQEAQILLSYYFHGNSSTRSLGNFGDYPIEQQTKATDVALGREDVVFLTSPASGRSYSEGFNRTPYAFPIEKVTNISGVFTNVADPSLIELVLGAKHYGNLEILAEAVKLHAASITGIEQYLDFYSRYVEYVFDSEDSYLRYIQSLGRGRIDQAQREDDAMAMKNIYGLNSLSEEERGRAVDLWKEHRILPPFLTEFCVPKRIAIPEDSIAKAEQILSRKIEVFYDKTRQQITTNLKMDDERLAIDSEEHRYQVNTQKVNEAYGKPINELIGLLSESCPLIKTLYNQPVVEDEDRIITVAEHTKNVADVLSRIEDEINIPLGLEIEDLRLLFTVHDLGKAAEMMAGPQAARDHQQTREIATILMGEISQIDEPTKKIIIEVLSQDILGRYIRGYVTPEIATSQICNTATKLDVNRSELFELFKLYYFCDASSYSTLENYVRSSQGNYQFSEDYGDVINELGSRVEKVEE
jgi:hypothetical protein